MKRQPFIRTSLYPDIMKCFNMRMRKREIAEAILKYITDEDRRMTEWDEERHQEFLYSMRKL